MSTATKTTKKYHCNECRREFPYQKLDRRTFLCEKCRKVPGVEGYRGSKPALTRGLRSGCAEYWERTRHTLNIVTDEEPTDPIHHVASVPTDDADKPTLRRWRGDVLYADLTMGTRMVLVGLAEYADWRTGGDCWPGVATLARTVRIDPRHVRRHLRRAEKAGWIEVRSAHRNGGRQAANQYVLTWPDGRRLSEHDRRRRA